MELELEMEKEKEASKFATPAQSKLYQPAVALEFFKSAGKAENFAPGKSVFVESEGTASMFSEGARMYLLLDGEVTPDRLLSYLQSVPAAFDPDARPQQLEWMIRQAKSISGR